ncbi:MAG: DUF421 domain-containing protein [Actinomycetota bacterium]
MNWLVRHVFDHPSAHGIAEIAIKTAIVYLFLIAGLRLLGKRELGQMSVYDLVMMVVLGNAVQNAMINGDNTLGGGFVAAAVLLVLNRGFNAIISRSRRAEHVLVGAPVLLVNDGAVIASHMKRESVTMEQLEAALREHGMNDVSEAHTCVLEVDGTISVVAAANTKVMKSRRHYRGLRLP